MEELIIKYLSGNASSDEIGKLEDWVLADSENKKLFMAIKKAWMLAGAATDQSQVNVDRLWTKTSDQLFPETKVVSLAKRNRRPQWIAIAAAVIGLIVLGVWLLNRNANPALTYMASNSPKELLLPDGSEVFLRKNSSITFHQNGKKGKREVKLAGVAFFEVKRDEKRPFEISTSSIKVKVLGTSFLVDAREGVPEADVIVQSGLVRVSLPGKDSVELQAGEGSSYSKTSGSLDKMATIDPNYLSFATDSLVFDNTPMDQVAEALSRHFNENVSIENEELRSCKVNGTYTSESLEEILRLLEISNGVKFRKEDSRYLISGSCN